jgi:threonine/homoserine efflux transporter RhtA
LIWTVVGTIIAFSYRASGAESTIWVPITYVIGPFCTALISLRFGEGSWTKLDLVCLLGVAIGLILWVVYRSSHLTLGISIGIDFLGALPTIRKSFREPYSEDLFSWLLFWLANTINLLAIDRWEWQIIVYPLYMVVVTTAICWCLRHGRLRQQQKRQQRRKIHLN